MPSRVEMRTDSKHFCTEKDVLSAHDNIDMATRNAYAVQENISLYIAHAQDIGSKLNIIIIIKLIIISSDLTDV